MALTEDELEQKRQRNEKLREQVAQEEAKRVDREAGLGNDLTGLQLDAEAARLQAALDAAKHSNKVAAVKEGTSYVTDALKEDLHRAEVLQKAQQAQWDQMEADKAAAKEKAEADRVAAREAADKAAAEKAAADQAAADKAAADKAAADAAAADAK